MGTNSGAKRTFFLLCPYFAVVPPAYARSTTGSEEVEGNGKKEEALLSQSGRAILRVCL